MNLIHYKAIFKGNDRDKKESLNLTFRTFNLPQSLRVPPYIILELKKRISRASNIISFQNIEEVLILGDSKPRNYNYFIVILYTLRDTKKKEGYLIGNLKNQGDFMIGYWPFNGDLSNLSEDTIRNQLEDLINNSDSYETIALITQ